MTGEKICSGTGREREKEGEGFVERARERKESA
jgi:hypothetical protein